MYIVSLLTQRRRDATGPKFLCKMLMKHSIKDLVMSTIEIYDPALCCSTGVCGVEVDQHLVTFAADVEWAKQHDVMISRFNLGQQPLAFANNPVVKAFLQHSGAEALPLVLLDGEIALAGRYPTRAELSRWTKINPNLPMIELVSVGATCCADGDCC